MIRPNIGFDHGLSLPIALSDVEGCGQSRRIRNFEARSELVPRASHLFMKLLRPRIGARVDQRVLFLHQPGDLRRHRHAGRFHRRMRRHLAVF